MIPLNLQAPPGAHAQARVAERRRLAGRGDRPKAAAASATVSRIVVRTWRAAMGVWGLGGQQLPTFLNAFNTLLNATSYQYLITLAHSDNRRRRPQRARFACSRPFSKSNSSGEAAFRIESRSALLAGNSDRPFRNSTASER